MKGWHLRTCLLPDSPNLDRLVNYLETLTSDVDYVCFLIGISSVAELHVLGFALVNVCVLSPDHVQVVCKPFWEVLEKAFVDFSFQKLAVYWLLISSLGVVKNYSRHVLTKLLKNLSTCLDLTWLLFLL